MSQLPNWGPENPHPLSVRRTELVWEGKYDEYGNRRQPSLPVTTPKLEVVERISAPGAQHSAPGDIRSSPFTPDPSNLLIRGENKLAMAALLETHRGKINLIYVDPPFDARANFSVRLGLGAHDVRRGEAPSLQSVAYRDYWGRDGDSYAHMMYERLQLMRELLANDGSIYVQCDWRASGLMRLLLDEVFDGNHQNEIIWCYIKGASGTRRFGRKHNTIFWYSKSLRPAFNLPAVAIPYSPETIARAGRGDPRYIQDPSELESRGKNPGDVWTDVPPLQGNSVEYTGFGTQKPEALIERIILASSREGDLVADFFCGSGTTLAVAERLGRRWIGVDQGRHAIQVSRKRMIQLERECPRFGAKDGSIELCELGADERRWWMKTHIRDDASTYRSLILDRYGARPFADHTRPHLHGALDSAGIHVAPIDLTVGGSYVAEIAREARGANVRELQVLAWDFDDGLAASERQVEAKQDIPIRLIKIPREILEKNGRDCEFFQIGTLQVRAHVTTGTLEVEIERFVPPVRVGTGSGNRVNDAVPERSPFDFIDSWAVDFEWDPARSFRPQWHDWRTRRKRALKLKTNADWKYATQGDHRIRVKVVDVFGMETTTTITVTC